MQFYPMLAGWLEIARCVEIRETTLLHETPIPAPARAIPSAAPRDARPGNPASTLYDN
ncbi:hypothetical protein LJ655_05375 [Paraburkholderia sp. MMS20-SJTN17]|uniref:Uncharacterized protein n=1 Tax=Paraburkholderia translucens TaxID=2886945 RepID=A0ABS8K9A4_9BURK|nr:hypothetical protein [Paraburkholderia sp. MMS20-SJTN17]MCC8401331.1 hypothetical protein [Paraburkholderia sp. MMS20-SJTN17]